jgi:UDP-N-acetylmuramate--alanine ligase
MEKLIPQAQRMPLDVGLIHIIGMSGIAEILHNLGYSVQGSDIADSPNVLRLREKGMEVKIGHKGENVEGVAVVVKSSAVKNDNPEIMEARKRKIPVIRRAEMLAEIVRLKNTVSIAGTHGKTTTTSMVAHLFEKAGREPTVINGGIINTKGTNAYLGSGDWLVAEADESDGTFIKLPSVVGIVTNIDPEHLEHYGSFDAVKEAFYTFVTNLPFYGFAVLCADHPEVKKLSREVTDRTIITYSVEKDESADVLATNIRPAPDGVGSLYDVRFSARVTGGDHPKTIKDIELPMPGIHNVSNSLAALGVAAELKFPETVLKDGFKDFAGVKRRFTKTGEVGGVLIIDDYGHHPTEIMATLRTARTVADKRGGRVIAIAQPHRYSRVHDLFAEFGSCFKDADMVYISEIYSAGESPIDGISRESLVEVINRNGKKASPLGSEEELPRLIAEIGKPGDLVVFLGAGTVTKWANALPEQLADEVGASVG